MFYLNNLESNELGHLLERVPLCLNFAIPPTHRHIMRSSVDEYIAEIPGLLAVISCAEHWERIASIDQTSSDFEFASQMRHNADKAHAVISNSLSRLLSNLGSKEAASVARTAIQCEIQAIKTMRSTNSATTLSRFAEFQTLIAVGPAALQQIVEVYAPIYKILANCAEDEHFLYYFSQHHREFEIFIADCYKLAGWDKVELTPQRGDGGRDVIATRHDIGTIRILEQTKAYSAGRLVTHNDIRAMIGVLSIDRNASKGIITTTSDFQPSVMANPEFTQFMPFRLELRNGANLRRWLADLRAGPDLPPRG